jgi:hypothetical protein
LGFIADRENVPDVWDLADLHIAEITRSFDATGGKWATDAETPPGVTRPTSSNRQPP